MRRLFHVLFLLFWSTVTLQAQIKMEVNPSQVEVGDTFKLSLLLPEGIENEVDWEDLFDEPLFVYQVLEAKKKKIDGEQWLEQDLYLMSFDTGTIHIGPFDLPGNLETEEVSVQVALVDVDTTKAFMDIKEAEKLEFWWGDYWAWILGLVLLILSVIAFLWWRSQRKKASEEYVVTEENAHEWALEALAVLKSKYANRGEDAAVVKAYFDELAQLFKKYLSYRYHWSAEEETSEELIDRLKNHNDFRNYRKEIRTLLNTSDLVKFAKAHVVEEEQNRQWRVVKKLIESTRFKEEINK